MQTIQRRDSGVHPPPPERLGSSSPILHFDKISIRMPLWLSDPMLDELRMHATSAVQDFGRHINGGRTPVRLTIVAPEMRALELLSRLEGLFVNCVEIARNILTATKDDAFLLAEYDRYHFARKKRRRTVQKVHKTTTYNRPFAGYWDKGCKVTGRAHTFHKEGRYQGVQQVRRLIGGDQVSDLVRYVNDNQFAEYWRKHDGCYYAVDLERLGRYHRNTVERRRRKSSAVPEGRWSMTDRRIGDLIFRGCGRTVQGLVDGYGRGPFLTKLQCPSIVYTNPSSDPLNASGDPLARVLTLTNGSHLIGTVTTDDANIPDRSRPKRKRGHR